MAFEYKHVKKAVQFLEEDFGVFDQDGWEVVGFDYGPDNHWHYLMKRTAVADTEYEVAAPQESKTAGKRITRKSRERS